MPARTVVRCRPKSSSDLGLIEEINCVYWVPLIPGTQFKNLESMRSVWNRHGSRILANYVRHRPGTRPFAMYALGELRLPPLRHQPLDHLHRTTIGETVFFSAWHYFGTRTGPDGYYCGGTTWGEFHYLRRIGVVDDAEATLAEQWIDDRHYDPSRQGREYEAMATD
jgi:hypothetical protein